MNPIHVLIVDGVAADADAARRLMRDSRPDVMTLNLTLPGIDGLQFLHDIQGQRHPPIIVVSSSSKAGACETAQAFQAGAVACFDKAKLLRDVPKFIRALKKAAQCKTKAVRRSTRRAETIQHPESAGA